MKDAIKGIVGEKIKGVVVKKSDGVNDPKSQVFLLFDDDSYYEFYSVAKILGAGGIDKGGIGAIRGYMPDNEIILEYEI